MISFIFMRHVYNEYFISFWTGQIVPHFTQMQEPIHTKEKLYLDPLSKIQRQEEAASVKWNHHSWGREIEAKRIY